MKWATKKPSSYSSSSSVCSSASSSSHPHLISHVFPLSWLSKFKQSPTKTASRIPQNNHKSKPNHNNPNPNSPHHHSSYRNSRFYTKNDEDAFWRLSFDTEEASNKNIRTQNEATKNEGLLRTYKRIIRATSELQRELDQVSFNGFRKSFESENDDLLQIMKVMSTNYEEKRQQMKNSKAQEFLSKYEKQRKSFYVSREIPSKVKVRSPRAGEICKVKALEKMKKTKTKKMKEKAVEKEVEAAALESFAVVKCSCNPQEDFRESMIEMIIEKSIRRPEELEELLACYLTLNADEYHDLIIKVFRQVWLELEEAYFNHRSSIE